MPNKKVYYRLLNQILHHSKPVSVVTLAFIAGMVVHESLYPAIPPVIQTPNNFNYQVCFTPQNQCLPLIIKAIEQAKESIYLQGYSFTSPAIGNALIKAHLRKVKVIILLDKSQINNPHSQIHHLQGIPIYIDHKPTIAHNKAILIDQKTILGGSYNWTNGAEKKNAENLTLITNPEFAKLYLKNFEERLKLSKLYRPNFVKKTL